MKKFNKIVLLQRTGIEEFALEGLQKISNEVIRYDTPPGSNEEIIERCTDADCVLVTFTSHMDAEVISSLPHLRHIGLCCSKYDDESSNVDLQTCRENGVSVSGVSEYGDDGVIEFIIGELSRLMIGTGSNMFLNEPAELKSLHMGIIGLGSLGKKVAKVASFFDMKISYSGRSQKQGVDYDYLDKDALLKNCDVISLHLPRNIVPIEQREFDLMKGPKIIIDTGIGFSFDQVAFQEWIKADNHYAIFDMASVDLKFKDMYKSNPRVIINPRVTGFTKNARQRLASHVLDNLHEYFNELENQ